MEKITTKNIKQIHEETAHLVSTRSPEAKSEADRFDIMICRSTGCESNKAKAILEQFESEIKKHKLDKKVCACQTGCFGICENGPIVKIMPGQIYYINVSPDDVPELVEQHLVNRKPVDRLMLPEQKGKFIAEKDISVFDKQKRIVLRNNGLIDPEKIKEYIAAGGYTALGKVLDSMSPDDVIEELKVSEIRGRGGAGFPTWLKWLNTKKEKADKKYIICNGDEGDPGAFMDRSILEGDPHAIIEAMTIAAYTAGASKGYFYIRAEYVLAIKRVKHAIKQAYKHGVIGEKVMGSDFSFDLDIRLGAGAFVCGEETALIASVEGKRGTPSPRPPYPSQKGLFEKPTLINNVETLANIPEIINKGGKWFATIGTKDSKGTKVFALTGKINISGLIEVPMGTTIKDIIYEMGGGIANGKKVKAVQTGGPSGGIIPEQYFDTPIDYKNLQKLGSMMGSGGMIVMDEDDSMVDIAKFYIGFSVDESCGKCAPCRIGNYQMFKILERFTKKRGKEEDIEKLKKIALAMQKGSLCGLGQTSPNPVVSTLRFFEEEYLSNTRKK